VLNAFGGINVQVWTCTGKPEQLWTVGANGQLKTKSDGWCIDIQLSGNANLTNAWTYPCGSQHTNVLNQKWQVPSTKGQIISVNGKCLEVVQNGIKGANVRIANCVQSNDQIWNVHSDGTISNEESGLCLDAGSWKD